ncbi:MAG: DNA topoisomerase I [Methanobacteriota archaeon]|nr:MAG: DNA topoisomerase I [Euryarchaeota archaeon]
MRVIVAEKPKVANKIAYALGITKRRAFQRRVSVYEDSNNVVIPAVGHIFKLKSSVKGYGYPVFDISWEEAHKVDKRAYYTKPYIEAFKSYSKEADSIVVATDYDNEGSLIGYNVARFIFKGVEPERMKFSTLTAGELKKAYENREGFDYGNAVAGETRHMVDWFYGINLSRALMQAIKTTGKFRIMSIGRVQGPALAITSRKEEEIGAFIPEPFWTLSIEIKGQKFTYEGGNIKDEEKAKELYKKIGKEATIVEVKEEEKDVYAPPPFDLTSLQVEAYRVFKISPAKTLQLAQVLYESSLISYPRTSSQKLPPSIGFKKILEKLREHNKSYSKEAEELLSKGGKLWPRQGRKEDAAHPAIYPTGVKPTSLEGEEKKLYELIASRFVALFMPPMKRITTQVKAETNKLLFKAEGTRVAEKGWSRAVEHLYQQKEKEIVEFKEGERHKIDKKGKKKEMTKAPPRYSEASLVKELEKKGLGTKATRAVVISTLFARRYLFKGPGGIHVTDLGMSVYKILSKHVPEIMSEELTRDIEASLEEITEKPDKQKKVLDKTKKVLTKILEKFREDEKEIGKEFVDALSSMREKAIAYSKKKK